MRSWHRWLRLSVMWGMLIGLQIKLWQPGGLLTTYRLHEKVAAQTLQLAQHQARNQKLAAHYQWLIRNKEAVEHYARQDLGMVKSGETFYIWVEK